MSLIVNGVILVILFTIIRHEYERYKIKTKGKQRVRDRHELAIITKKMFPRYG